MKNVIKVLGIIALVAVIGFSMVSCGSNDNGGDDDNGNGSQDTAGGNSSHTHQWGEWTQITAPTYTTEGEETRTCDLDETHKENRPISRIPFTTVAEFATWLADQPTNTVATTYNVKLNISNISTPTSLGTTLKNAADKYVGVDLSDSTITSIPNEHFRNFTTITSIIIPDSVTSGIGNYTFSRCSNLSSVTIGNGVTSIGNYAFDTCSNLSSVTIGNSVTSIGDYAFQQCSKLTSVIIPDSVKTIGNNAFNNCNNLASITIGNNVTSIGNSAFSSCSRLTSVTIPASVTSIGNGAFNACSGLTSVTIPASVTAIGSSAFNYCRSLTSVTFTTGSNIADDNFGNNAFPDGVSTNGDGTNALKTAYKSGKAGTYIRNGYDWVKQ